MGRDERAPAPAVLLVAFTFLLEMELSQMGFFSSFPPLKWSAARVKGSALALVVAFTLSGCGGSSEEFVFTGSPVGPQPTNSHLLAVYMVGSDLESDGDAGTADFLEMTDGLRSMTPAERADLDLVIAFGGAEKDGWRGVKWMDANQLLADSEDGEFGDEVAPGSYLFEDDSANMADPATLTSFLRFVATNYPDQAERFVILWNHGGAYGGFGVDEVYNQILSLSQIDGAFADSGLPRLDLVGFDACLMASVEVAQSVEQHAAMLVASEELEPGHGWNYRYVVPALVRASTPTEYAVGLVDDYVDSANHPYQSRGKSLSVLALGELDQLLAALNSYSELYAPGVVNSNPVAPAFALAVTTSQAFGANPDGTRDTIDLVDFAQRSRTFGAVGDAATNSLLAAVERMVIYTNDDGSFERAEGVAIIPPDLTGQKLSADGYPSQGWLQLTQASINLILSDRAAPVLSNLTATPQGLLASFVDPLLVRVSAVNGLQTPQGGLIQLLSEAATPLSVNQFQIEAWDGQTIHLQPGPGAAPVPVPLTFSRFITDDGQTLGLFLAQAELLQTGAGNTFEKATITLAVNSAGQVVDFEIRTSFTDEEGEDVEDKVLDSLSAGDQLRLFARLYQVGPQAEPAFAQLGGDIVLAQNPTFALQRVTPDAGFALAFGILGQDFGRNVTLSALQPVP